MQDQKLKFVLKANAAFSITSGLAMLLFHDFISRWMGVSQPHILMFVGAGLLLFAITIIWTARQKKVSEKNVKIIIWQDWLWVAGSILVIALQLFGLNILGYIVIGVVAIAVADFAILQRRYLR